MQEIYFLRIQCYSFYIISIYDRIQAIKHVSWENLVKIEALLYEVPYIISYAEFSRKSIFGIVNARSSSVWPIFFTSYVIFIKKGQWKSSFKRCYKI